MLERKTLRRIDVAAEPVAETRSGSLDSKLESSMVTAPLVVTPIAAELVSARSPRSNTSTNLSVSGPLAPPEERMLWPLPLSRIRPPGLPTSS